MQAEVLASAYRLWKRNWKGKGREYTAGALVWQVRSSYTLMEYLMKFEDQRLLASNLVVNRGLLSPSQTRLFRGETWTISSNGGNDSKRNQKFPWWTVGGWVHYWNFAWHLGYERYFGRKRGDVRSQSLHFGIGWGLLEGNLDGVSGASSKFEHWVMEGKTSWPATTDKV